MGRTMSAVKGDPHIEIGFGCLVVLIAVSTTLLIVILALD